MLFFAYVMDMELLNYNLLMLCGDLSVEMFTVWIYWVKSTALLEKQAGSKTMAPDKSPLVNNVTVLSLSSS